MLTFLRKHQKIFLSVVAIFTIASFLFFGSYSVMQPNSAIPDRAVGKTVNGRPVMHDELALLIRFLNTSPFERQLFEKGGAPNLLNDGVVQKDFLQTGFAVMVSERHFDLFKEEMEKRLERVKNYHPYVHPQAGFLSAENIWQRFHPSLHQHYEVLLGKREADAETVALFASLYLDQAQFPPDVLRNILKYHQSQYEWLSQDPLLNQGDLSLFGFTTLEDWMGKRFISLLAQVILNGAAVAQEQGYTVSADEARASLQENVRIALRQLGNKEVTQGQLEQLYQRQATALHWQEEKVVSVWQKVLLFRKIFRDQGAGIIVDPQMLASSATFAEEQVKVDVYRLPSELELKNFRDLLKLQIYIEAVSPASSRKTKSASLGLPIFYASLEEIEKRTPELVQTRYDIELQSVTSMQLAESVALKEVYAWELEALHWEGICKAFPILKNEPFSTREERYQALEKMPLVERSPIDFFAKLAIVKSHPEWLETAFEKTAKQKVEFGLRLQGGDLPFQGISDREHLKTLLESTSIGDTISYSPDEEHHYRITLLKSAQSREIMTFADASQDGTLDLILDRQLSQAYPDVRKKHPALFALKEGDWKPYKEVQDLVGAEVYADLLQKIEDTTRTLGVSWPAQRSDSLDVYVKYRLMVHLDEACGALSSGAAEEGWIQLSSGKAGDVTKQWRLVKEEHTLKRTEARERALEGLFEGKTGEWSSIQSKSLGGNYFYYLREKINKDGNTDAVIEKARGLLSMDAQRMMFSDLLEKMTTQNLMIVLFAAEDEM